MGLGVPDRPAGHGPLLVLGPLVLPEYKDPDAGRLDLLSAALSLVAILGVIFGLKQVAQDGFGAMPVVAIGLVGMVAGVIFVRRQVPPRRPDARPQPVPDPDVQRAARGQLPGDLRAIGYFLFVAQYLQLVARPVATRGRPVVACPSAIGFIVGSNAAPRLMRYIRPAYLMARRADRAAIGLAVLLPRSDAPMAWPSWSCGVDDHLPGPGAGLRPDDRADRRVGAAGTGRCGLGHLRDRRRARRRARDLDPRQHRRRDLPRWIADGAARRESQPDVVDVARDTLGAAMAVAAELPGQLGAAVVSVASEAFVEGMQARRHHRCRSLAVGRRRARRS